MTEREKLQRSLERSYPVKDVAEALGCNIATVYEYIKSGELKAWRRPLRFRKPGPYRIDEREIQRFKTEGAWAVERKTPSSKVAFQVASRSSRTSKSQKRGRQ